MTTDPLICPLCLGSKAHNEPACAECLLAGARKRIPDAMELPRRVCATHDCYKMAVPGTIYCLACAATAGGDCGDVDERHDEREGAD